VNPSVLPPPATVVRCRAAAHAVLRVPADELPALRQKPHPTLVGLLPLNLLKHADDQTVVGLAAVLRAIGDFHLSLGGFTDWGFLSAPRFLGRAAMAQALQKFAQEGAWGISPHLIPHRSLHAPSGTISQALKIHGPNLGVGGGPGADVEGLLAAAALLAADRLPGVWLLLTGNEHEEVFGAAKPGCLAVAMALVNGGGGPLELEVAPGDSTADSTPFALEALAAALTAGGRPAAESWRLGGGRLRLIRNAVREERLS
jgi:hypothetical protein